MSSGLEGAVGKDLVVDVDILKMGEPWVGALDLKVTGSLVFRHGGEGHGVCFGSADQRSAWNATRKKPMIQSFVPEAQGRDEKPFLCFLLSPRRTSEETIPPAGTQHDFLRSTEPMWNTTLIRSALDTVAVTTLRG